MGKVVMLRGTSGSGKSHLAREIMAKYEQRTPHFTEGRKQPYYYEFRKKGRRTPLFVLGHYETACGGCDTIKTADEVFGLVAELRAKGDVLFEGLLLSADVNRTTEAGKVHNVFIDLPIEKCLAQVNARRRKKDPTKGDVNPENTTSKHRGVRMACERLKTAKQTTFSGSYEECRDYVLQVLGL